MNLAALNQGDHMSVSVTFKAKAHDGIAKIPVLTRNHADMPAFRRSSRFGDLANSDLFLGILRGKIRTRYGTTIRVDDPPDGATVKPGYLHTVTLSL